MRLKADRATAAGPRLVPGHAGPGGGLVAAGMCWPGCWPRAITEPGAPPHRAAARLAEGDLDVSVPVSGGAEMAALAAGFNAMAGACAS